MFRVEWLQSALDELTILLTRADPLERHTITAVNHALDKRFSVMPISKVDPDQWGDESRSFRLLRLPSASKPMVKRFRCYKSECFGSARNRQDVLTHPRLLDRYHRLLSRHAC
jgi:hypothetical protein